MLPQRTRNVLTAPIFHLASFITQPARVFLLAVVAIAFVGCAHRAPLNRLAIDHQRRALQFLARDKVDNAEAELHLALEYNPDFPEALNALGLVAERRGLTEQAYEYFRQALLVDDDFAEAQNNIGVILYRRSEMADAAAAFRSALAVDPGYADARYNFALALIQLGHAAEAEFELRKVTLIDSKNPRYVAELGCLYTYLDRRAQADAQLDRAMSLDSRQAPVYRCRGILARKAGLMKRSNELLTLAFEIDPSDDESLQELAIGLAAAKQYQEAIDRFLQLLMRSPEHPGALFALGWVYAEMNKLDRAERYLRRSLRFRSNFSAAMLALGDLLDRRGDHPNAIYLYRRFLRRVPLRLVHHKKRVTERISNLLKRQASVGQTVEFKKSL